jgi:hypothetical protein
MSEEADRLLHVFLSGNGRMMTMCVDAGGRGDRIRIEPVGHDRMSTGRPGLR